MTTLAVALDLDLAVFGTCRNLHDGLDANGRGDRAVVFHPDARIEAATADNLIVIRRVVGPVVASVTFIFEGVHVFDDAVV